MLVGCSGGADSLALVLAAGFVAPRLGIPLGAVVVDHGLQPGSAEVAARAAAQCRDILPRGAHVEVRRVQVVDTSAGPEGNARSARLRALSDIALDRQASAVLLGHTRDDQAEQVLLGLARGSGARSLSGMSPARRVREGVSGGVYSLWFGRPFLGDGGERQDLAVVAGGVDRAQTAQVCAEAGVVPWQDPHNDDDRYARVRARALLRDVTQALGSDISSNLLRTAQLLRDDADALDALARAQRRALGNLPWAVEALDALPRAVRTRLWRDRALVLGSPGTDLTSEHLWAVDALVTNWRGQGPVHLPGRVRAGRSEDRVWLRREA